LPIYRHRRTPGRGLPRVLQQWHGRQWFRRCRRAGGERRRGARRAVTGPLSACRAVAVRHAGGGEDELPDLQGAGAESAGAAEQIVLPHAVEALALRVVGPRPTGLEVVVPGDQSLVVVRPDIVNIYDSEEIVDGSADLRHGGDDAAGEDVL